MSEEDETLQALRCMFFGTPNPKENLGNFNEGASNIGNRNVGGENVGSDNHGSGNRGCCNIGHFNVGNNNLGDRNHGDENQGNRNYGDKNIGDDNIGSYNEGSRNVGSCNKGSNNIGFANVGNYCLGDFNQVDDALGAFCTMRTVGGETFRLFNRKTSWNRHRWEESEAYAILRESLAMPVFCNESEHSIRVLDSEEHKELMQEWWIKLAPEQQEIILEIPNFDREIFKQCTGVDVCTEP